MKEINLWRNYFENKKHPARHIAAASNEETAQILTAKLNKTTLSFIFTAIN